MNEKRPIPVVVDEKRDLHQRLWMNKKRPIQFFFYSSATPGIGSILFIHNLWYGSLLFIHNLCHRSFYSFTASGIGLFLFIVVDE
jgi:hypothetical protein